MTPREYRHKLPMKWIRREAAQMATGLPVTKKQPGVDAIVETASA